MSTFDTLGVEQGREFVADRVKEARKTGEGKTGRTETRPVHTRTDNPNKDLGKPPMI